MENFLKDFKFTFLLTVVICLLVLIPVIGPILIVGGISIIFLNSAFEDRETPEVKKESEPLFDSDLPDRLTDNEPSSIEIEKNLQVKDLVEIVLSQKKIDTEADITSYFKAISKIRSLRPDEELHLTRKVADLIYFEKLSSQYESEKGHLPSDKEWAELTNMPVSKFKKRLLIARRAREIIVQHNLNLVVSIAKKYMNRGLSFQALIQVGGSGLISAAGKFDDEKGYKFSTFSTWYIRKAITRAITDRLMNFSTKIPKGKKEYSKQRDSIEEDILRQDLERVMVALNPRERDVLRMRYGMDDGRKKSLNEIGKIFKVTGARISQIEQKALSKLRNPNNF